MHSMLVPRLCAPRVTGADLGFEKGGFNVVPKSDTGGATNNYL